MRSTIVAWVAACCVLLSCGPRPPESVWVLDEGAATPASSFAGHAGLTLGEPLAVALDFTGRVIVADGSPGRLVRWSGESAQEFPAPRGVAGFYPTDVAVSGFFVLAVDEPGRTVVRFDDDAAYRDVLLRFEGTSTGRRVSPYSIAVDGAGRIAVSDVENHQVLVFDAYLEMETAFGNYGSYPGQLDTPTGVAFSPQGDVVVTDAGNRRVQVFSDGGSLQRVVPAPDAPNPLRRPRRAVADERGRIYVADPRAGAVFVFDAAGVLVRGVTPRGVARFSPTDVARGRDGDLYVTDEATRTVYVFRGI